MVIVPEDYARQFGGSNRPQIGDPERLALQGRKTKPSNRVPGQREVDETVTEATDAVEEDDRVARFPRQV